MDNHCTRLAYEQAELSMQMDYYRGIGDMRSWEIARRRQAQVELEMADCFNFGRVEINRRIDELGRL